MSYNGWTNYETWCVNLWWTNDEQSDREARLLARDFSSGLETGELAALIKERTEDLCYGDLDKACLASDLMRAALSDVIWQELARAWVDA